MNSSRRWLIIFGIAIGILIIATVSLVLLTKGKEVALLSEDTPQGIVQRYLIAVQEQNYQQAFNYLSFEPSEKIKTYDNWLRTVIGEIQHVDPNVWKATLGKTTQNDDNATVAVTIDILQPGGPLGDSLRSQQLIFQLIKINEKWFIISPTYIYWIY